MKKLLLHEEYESGILLKNIWMIAENSHKSIVFIDSNGTESKMSYDSLYKKALTVLANLQDRGITPGMEAIFQINREEDFIVMCWACMLGGIIPVPFNVATNYEQKQSLMKVWNTLSQPFFMTEQSVQSKLLEFFQEYGEENSYEDMKAGMVLLEELEDMDSSDADIYETTLDDIVFLLFSSGSTGDPKAVTLTYENLINHTKALKEHWEVEENTDLYLNWMPLNHCMGLVLGHFTAALLRIDQVMMHTPLFVSDPMLWLRKADEYKATILSSPNFGLMHVTNELAKNPCNEKLDLSRVRMINNTAEPISIEVCNNFLDSVEKFGMKRNVIAPFFGMTEGTIGISFSKIGDKLKAIHVDRRTIGVGDKIIKVRPENGNGITFAGLGAALPCCSIRICDGDDMELEDETIGHVQIKGKSITRGYYNNVEATNASFTDDGWLRTGDTGFICDGQLAINGRVKDIVFINGQNFYPHDIERIAESAEGVGGRKIVACAVHDEENNKESVGIFVHDNGSIKEFIKLIPSIKATVNEKMGLDVYDVVPIEEVPKTRSGKLLRYQLGKKYNEGGFAGVLHKIYRELSWQAANKTTTVSQPETELEKKLFALWNGIMRNENLDMESNFFELGINSMLMLKVLAKIKTEFGVEIDISTLFECKNLRKLAKVIEQKDKVEAELVYPLLSANPDQEYESFPLTEIQMAYLIGREEGYELGGISTHVYIELVTKADMTRLNEALRKVIQKHPMMRAVFVGNEQRILKEVPAYQIATEDMCSVSEEEFKNLVEQERERMSHDVFNPQQWPLFEFKALKKSEDTHVLFIGLDMLIVDAASLDMVATQIMEFYNNPTLSTQQTEFTFRDYVVGYHEFKNSKTYQKDKEFWMDKLPNFPSAPALPLLKEPSELGKPHFKRVQQLIDKDDWERITKQAIAHNVTPSALLCMIYMDVLAFWSNQPKLAINLTVVNRYPFHKEVEELVGDFTSVIPLDCDFSKGEGFWAKAAMIQKTIMEDLQHRHYDGVEFVRELAAAHNYGNKVVIPVVFTSLLSNELWGKWNRIGDINHMISQTSQVYLDYQVSEIEGKILVNWDYMYELLDGDMVGEMFDLYMNILTSLANDVEPKSATVLNSMYMLTENYNDTEEEITPVLLQQAFEQQAEKYPDHTAIIDGNTTVSYRELNRQSNQLAHKLRESGVEAGDLIGVSAVRCSNSIVNIMAILKAGGGYIPIDPTYPKERVDYILEHSNCKLMLNSDFIEKEDISQYSIENPEPVATTDHTAYVIYTSGSTGKPKGVVISHGAAINTILDINQKFAVSAEDRVIGISSMCFDLSVYDIFGALLSGSALVQVPDQRDIFHLYETIQTEKITIWNSVPAIMDMMLDNVEPNGTNESLRLVLLSGDWIPVGLPDKIRAYFPNAQVISLGGATEASIWSIYYPIGKVDKNWKSIPYGVPLANQTYYVLNYNQELCPVGVEGELYIGGAGVAKEYYKDTEKTEASFINHKDYGRLYKTGDFGIFRLAVDNTLYIEFTGRKDYQVKIGGYRIELNDIETNLVTHESVERCIVIDKTDSENRKYICAYYISEEKLSEKELGDYMRKSVPDYMVPEYFMHVQEIPLTPNGKVDRKALPEVDSNSLEKREIEHPRTEAEQAVHDICCSILDVTEIGVHDNLFKYRLNSIKSVAIISRIEKDLSVKIKFKDFTRRSTIADVASIVQKSNKRTDREAMGVMLPDPEHGHDPFPVTEIQSAYIMGREEQFEIGNTSAHFYGEIDRDFDIDKLNRSFQKVIARHAMLRTVFVSKDSQKILEQVPNYEIEVLDFRGLENGEELFLKERERMSHHIFDIEQWPLFEIKAVKLDNGINRLMIGYDLLISDAASVLIVGNEVMEYYKDESLVKGEFDCTFRDYMLEYEKFKTKSDYAESKDYWMKKLPTFPTAPKLPLKMAADDVKKPHFIRLKEKIDLDKWKVIKDVSLKNKVTASSVLCTAYANVLGKWSNQSRMGINMTVFNRYPFHDKINDMVGDFTSTILVDVKAGGIKSFWEDVKANQETIMEALEYRHFDGVEFLRELSAANNFAPSTGMPIIFTSMLYENKQDNVFDFGKFDYSVSQTSQVYIDYQLMETTEGLSISWDYVEELFDKEMLENMFEQYIGILNAVGDNLDVCNELLPLEQIKLVENYNDTAEEINPELLHRMFERQAAEDPSLVAIIDGEFTMTYGELNEKANQVAHKLLEAGLGDSSLVGILAERCKESIVNILGILKAGGAYVPIDPGYPKDRVEYILKESNSKHLLKPDYYVENNLEVYSKSNPEVDITPEQTAYIIYTSGSTGKPKGVVISHGAAANTIVDINRKFLVGNQDKIIGISSMCFDLSVYDIFGALTSGAALVQIPDQRDVEHLYETIEKYGITIWNSVPAIMDMMLDSLDAQSKNSSLRLVLLSGDWIPLPLPNKIRTVFSSSEVISLGGATEASIWSIYYPVKEIDSQWKSIPYGIPLANQTYYVLDFDQKLCPINVEGELYIGGSGVAKEYYRDDEKTAAAMIAHESYGRIYRTGDYGAYRKDDNGKLYIEFLGRKDSQVKIGGFRIELSEIEKNLFHYEGIKNCIVIDKTDQDGKKYLCAYVVSEQTLEDRKIKEYLLNFLPEYMVPSYFVQMDELPLTQNGKIDRKALPEPGIVQQDRSEHTPPRNETERIIHDICCEILKVESIGVYDSLFQYSLNSVKTVAIITKIGKELHTKIKFKDFTRKNNIAEIALLIKNSDQSEQKEYISTMKPDPENRHKPYPLTEIQKAYIMGRDDQFEIGGTSAHSYGEIEGNFDTQRLNRSLNKVIQRHPMLRTVFLSKDEQQILEHVPDYVIEVLDFRGENEERFEEIRTAMSHHIFKPDCWPLFDVKVAIMEDNQMRLMLGYDLLIVDGASALILGNEIIEFYRDEDLQKQEFECTFRDYMLELEQFRKSTTYADSKHYWMEKLVEFPTAPKLPMKVKPSEITKPQFARLKEVIPMDKWMEIKKIAKEKKITAASILCTAYANVLAGWSNQDRMAINMTVFNRYPFYERINDMVGDFTSTLLIDVKVRDSKMFWEDAQNTQETIMEALEHRHFDGVEFVREISKYNNYATTAGMPIVFTSMIYDDNKENAFDFSSFSYLVSQTPQVYIDYQVIETKEGLSISWDYVEELFEKDMLENMFSHYIGLLNTITDSENSYQGTLLDQEKEIIRLYNKTEEEIRIETLHKLFEERAAELPDQIAVIEGDTSITYSQLNERSNRIAHWLVDQGVKENTLVGVLAERRIGSIVNIFGILKAGGAYVPIDPGYPKDRVEYILEQSNTELILEEDLWEQEAMKEYSTANTDKNYSPDNVAYVIYTSGSTGKPKGVVVSHGAAMNTIADINNKYQVQPSDRILGISSMCFDLSVYDIFGALTAGATLVQIPDQRDVVNIYETIEKHQITIWNSVPAIMDMMIQNLQGSISYEEAKELPVTENVSQEEKEVPILAPDRYFWSPAIQWDEEEQIDDYVYIEPEMLKLFPKFYFYMQNGHSKEEICREFSEVPAKRIKAFVSELIENDVLVCSITDPHHAFKMQEKLFVNLYDEDIVYNPASYDKFKKKQLSRGFYGSTGEKVMLQKNYEFPDYLEQRYSHRKFKEEEKVPFGHISQLLSVFMQRMKGDHIQYYYPCAGGLYPIDVFIYIKKDRVENLEQGIYYYSPIDNSLSLVNGECEITDDCQFYSNKAIYNSSAASIFMVYNAEATMPKYGGSGYLYACIDTGIMVGTMTNVAELLNIGTCSIGEMNFDDIKPYFNLNHNQVLIHTVEIGLKEDVDTFEIAFGNGTNSTVKVNVKDTEQSATDYEFTENVEVAPVNAAGAVEAEKQEVTKGKQLSDIENTSLRLVLLSGDWIPVSLPKKIKDTFKNSEVISLGGATEASIWSIYYPVTTEDENWKSIPYGKPLANQQFYVLDYNKELCHVGVPGELYIGGNGLALEYRNDKDKTEQAFVEHPKLGRIYRTGDYGVLSEDGIIEFLGRKDQQIKIRGYRIELGEIENCLMKYPGIENVCVVDFTDKGGKKYLCAYLVSDEKPKANELREHVLKELPEYMVPTFFIPIVMIPLTPNGKINKKSLPKPDVTKMNKKDRVQPRDVYEETIAGLWREVLGLEDIGINDNFFDVGGDSMLLVNVHARIDNLYPNMLRITDLFTRTTISMLAEYLKKKLDLNSKKAGIRAVKMPSDYFSERGGEGRNSMFVVSLDKAAVNHLNVFANSHRVETEDILAGIFCFTLNQISGEQKITLQTMLKEKNRFDSLSVDFQDISQFNHLFEVIHTNVPDHSYQSDDLNLMSFDKEKGSITPALVKKNQFNHNVNLCEFYDVVLVADKSGDQIEFVCEYNVSKLKADKVKSLVADYMQIIKAFIKQIQ